MQPLIEKIERIPLRAVWKHEAHHFTKWLADNLDVLGEVIGLDLSLVEREAAAGDFSLDLLAEDEHGRSVVVENQLGRSDHDHLGKLMTYLAAFEAPAAVWVVGDPRPEHTKAVAWLNDSSQADFYLLRAEAIRVGGSPPALLLTPIVGPSVEAKAVAKEKQEKSERHVFRKRFWAELLEQAATQTTLHAAVSPSESTYVGTSAGRSGLALNYVARQWTWDVQLYIDVGDSNLNDGILSYFEADRDGIEAAFGAPLEWQRLEERRACRIATPRDEGGYRTPQAEWPALHAKMIETMGRLERSLREKLRLLPPNESLGTAQGG